MGYGKVVSRWWVWGYGSWESHNLDSVSYTKTCKCTFWSTFV